MWSTLVWSLVFLIMVNDSFSAIHKPIVDTVTMTPSPIPDTEFEQVVAERYLFAPFKNECTAWTVLNNVSYVWQAASLPQYHFQAADGVWLLMQTNTNISNTHQSATGTLQMSYMSLSAKGTVIVLPEIDVNNNASFLVVSHNTSSALAYTAALISPHHVQLILCDRSDATLCRVTRTIAFPSILANTTRITSGIFVEDQGIAGWLYIASDSGLHGLDLSTFMIDSFLNGIKVSVSSLAWSSKRKTVFAGTEKQLWIYTYETANRGWRFEHIRGLIDAAITSLVYNDVQDKLWIGQETGITFLSPAVMSTGKLRWFFSRLAGQISNPGSDIGHLPFANITTLSVSHSTLSDSRVWLGAIHGVMRFDSNDIDQDAWRVFNSPRYMPNRDALVNVISLAVLSRPSNATARLGSAAVAVSSKGLSVLRFEMWTLAKKVEHFQAFFNQPNRHEKYGLVSSCRMSSWGDSRTCVKGATNSDALWTAMYVSSQSFRYKVTQDKAVKVAAWKIFEAVEVLNKITGISGYPARSFAKRTDFPYAPQWYPSPVYPTLQYQGDTSSDQIAGYEFAFPLVHDLLAETETEKIRAYTLLFNMTTHILTHDWYLVGENHTYTTWGIWNPIFVNDDWGFLDDRGLNSLQILAFLLQTYAYSGDEMFLDGAELLVESYQYDANLINPKMIAVCDEDFSDDQLAYLSDFNLIYAIDTIATTTRLSTVQKARAKLITDNLLEHMRIGLDLTQSGQLNQTRHLFSRPSAFPFDFDCNSLLNDGVWQMQRWPLELINWPQYIIDRLDIQQNFPAYCGDRPQSLQMLPPDERLIHKWSFSVYDLSLFEQDGLSEEDPVAFLISYWAMRYFNLLE
ncbi:unnamed protein product [Adineta steineri]|uniref:Uncharacterized protein n=1 Tax=Adineta steineri TaxID=433720 RepID=A0A815BIT2_9BILA|nr:unnamed protein product [Adineta steineri]